MVSLTKISAKRYLWARAALGLVALGGLLFALHRWHMGQLSWEPVELLLQLENGFKTQAAFAAELDQPYEVEIKFTRQMPQELLDTFVWTMGQASPLDIKWSVSNGDSLVAAGTCSDYLYLSQRGVASRRPGVGTSLKKGIKTWLGAPDRQVSKIGPGVARGVGRFQGRAGETYQVRFEVGDGIEALKNYPTTGAVRINREFHQRYYKTSQGRGLMGLAAIGLGVMAFCVWLGLGRSRPGAED